MSKEESQGLIEGDDGIVRCFWPENKQDYTLYHDQEWGFPEADDFRLFEKICLEGFQAGLSWLTILRKRERFREVFSDFDFNQVAEYTPTKVEELLEDSGIIRHRGKIESTINNAQRALDLLDEFDSLSSYFWQWEPTEEQRPKKVTIDSVPAKTEQSAALSKDLKKRGWSFVGPTTVYAFMQAMGMVNDHLEGCAHREVIGDARAKFKRPK